MRFVIGIASLVTLFAAGDFAGAADDLPVIAPGSGSYVAGVDGRAYSLDRVPPFGQRIHEEWREAVTFSDFSSDGRFIAAERDAFARHPIWDMERRVWTSAGEYDEVLAVANPPCTFLSGDDDVLQRAGCGGQRRIGQPGISMLNRYHLQIDERCGLGVVFHDGRFEQGSVEERADKSRLVVFDLRSLKERTELSALLPGRAAGGSLRWVGERCLVYATILGRSMGRRSDGESEYTPTRIVEVDFAARSSRVVASFVPFSSENGVGVGRHVRLSPDGKHIALETSRVRDVDGARDPRHIEILDARTGQSVREFPQNVGGLFRPFVWIDSNHVAYTEAQIETGKVLIGDIRDGRVWRLDIPVSTCRRCRPFDLAYAPARRTLAVAMEEFIAFVQLPEEIK